MKKNIIMLFITLMLIGTTAYSQVKIGVIDSRSILEKSKKGRTVLDALNKIQLEKQAKVKEMQQTIAKLEQEIRSPALNSKIREDKTIKLQGKQKELNRFYEDTKVELQQKYSKEILAIEKELSPIIQTIGKEKGFTIIFDSAQPGMSYFDKAVDITEEIIKVYDSGQSAK
jgi:outer membrane protein